MRAQRLSSGGSPNLFREEHCQRADGQAPFADVYAAEEMRCIDGVEPIIERDGVIIAVHGHVDDVDPMQGIIVHDAFGLAIDIGCGADEMRGVDHAKRPQTFFVRAIIESENFVHRAVVALPLSIGMHGELQGGAAEGILKDAPTGEFAVEENLRLKRCGILLAAAQCRREHESKDAA